METKIKYLKLISKDKLIFYVDFRITQMSQVLNEATEFFVMDEIENLEVDYDNQINKSEHLNDKF